MVAAPARGFYVIVPPEYRSIGCLPAEQFVPALMDLKGQPYYVGMHLDQLMPFIGGLPIGQVHDGTLRPYRA